MKGGKERRVGEGGRRWEWVEKGEGGGEGVGKGAGCEKVTYG